MNAEVQLAVDFLVSEDFGVTTYGGRYSVGFQGELVLRGEDERTFRIFAMGVAAGLERAGSVRLVSSIEQQLEKSPSHQAALKEGN